MMRPGTAAAAPARDPEAFGAPFWIFCLLTFVLVGRPQDYVPALSALRPALILTLGCVFLTLLSPNPGAAAVFRHRSTLLYLSFFGALCLGIPFGMYPRQTMNFVVFVYVVNVIYFVLFLVHVNSIAKFERVVLVLVLSVAAFTVQSLMVGGFYLGRFTTNSPMFDSNDVAFVEVCLLPLGVYVVLGRFKLPAKVLALGTGLAGVVLALFTGSRGGMLGMLTFLVLFIPFRVPGVSKSHKFAAVLLLAGAVLLNLDQINVERYQSVTNLDNDYNTTAEMGRQQVWRRGVIIYSQHPLVGVGAMNFPMAIGVMRATTGSFVLAWQTAHNSYVEILTETGTLGSVPFLALIVTSLWGLSRLRKHASLPPELRLAVPLILAGGVAQLLSAIFLSQGYSMFLTLWFALSASVMMLARLPAAQPVDSVQPQVAPARRTWGPVVAPSRSLGGERRLFSD